MFKPLLDDPVRGGSRRTFSALKYWLSGLEFLVAALRMNPPREGGEPVLFPANIAAYGPVSQSVKLALRGYLRSFSATASLPPGNTNNVIELLRQARERHLHSLVLLDRSDESLLAALPQGVNSIISDRKRIHPVPHYGLVFNLADRLLAGLLPLCYEVAPVADRQLLVETVAVTLPGDSTDEPARSADALRHLDTSH